MPKRNLTGIIISDKMDQTAVVAVEVWKEHPRYRKRYRVKKKYLADNPQNQHKVGDKVVVEECRPLSRRKCWRIIKTA